MDDLFGFTWDVPEGGFKWVKAKVVRDSPAETGELETVLTDGIPLGAAHMCTRYAPLKLYTGLFRTFAETPTSHDAILAFANTYGRLGEGDVLIELPNEGQTVLGTGETRSFWANEIRALHDALFFWDAVQANDLGTLQAVIQWTGEGVRLFDMVRRGQLIASPQFHPERLEWMRPGDLVLPALFVVQDIVNQHLKGRVSPRLLWNKDKTRLGLHIVPRSLIGAIWLQFAQAIDGRKEYRRCEECRTWFELSPDIARTSKLYCSNACRSRAYRKRQAEARRLHEQGKSIEEIAQALGTDVRTAQGWITRGGSTGGRKSREER